MNSWGHHAAARTWFRTPATSGSQTQREARAASR